MEQGNTPKPGVDNYAVYNGMGVAADQVFGNMTTALKAKDMYNDTLIVLTSGPFSSAASDDSMYVRRLFSACLTWLRCMSICR